MKKFIIFTFIAICFSETYQSSVLNEINEVYYSKSADNLNLRFDSDISYNDGSNGYGEFRFNNDEKAAMWYRPLTKCVVEGIQIYFPNSTDLVNSVIIINLRSILSHTSIGIPANMEYNFSQYNLTIGDFMGDILHTQILQLDETMLEQVLNINFSSQIDVGNNDFAIEIIGDFGGDNNDLIFWDGVNGMNSDYNHGFKYYPDGASFCLEGCWVPRLNFGISARVNYYGDHPPIISNIQELPDKYYSCHLGPYEVNAEIFDIGTSIYDGQLTSVKFYYENGFEVIEIDYTNTGSNNIYTGQIPQHPIGTTINYWWEATDNASDFTDNSNQHTIQRVPKSFVIREYNQGADILLIDDSRYSIENTKMKKIHEILNQLGYSTDYLNTKDSGILSSCGLDYYSNYILLQGLNGSGNLLVESFLENYFISRMSEGANILFSSVDYINEVASFNEGWNETNIDQNQFLFNFLHVNHFYNDKNPNNIQQNLKGVIYNQISENINNFVVNSPYTQNYFDLVQPTAIANEIFQIFDEELNEWTQYGGTIYDGIYKSIFLPWHLEGIENEEVLSTILEESLDWFGIEKTPIFLNIEGPHGYIFETNNQQIVIEAYDEEDDEIYAELFYSINNSMNIVIPMQNLGENIFSAEIPSQSEGNEVTYKIILSDATGQIESQEYSYEVYQINSSILLILNNEMEVGQLNYPSEYYLLNFVNYEETGNFNYFITPDYWTLTEHGLTSEDLLNKYSTIIEITTTADYDLHPNYNEHLNLMKNWLDIGNKNYFLAGDETFALVNGNWSDVNYQEDDILFQLGVQSTINDVSWGGVSNLYPVENDVLSNEIYGHLNQNQSLEYDPENIIGYTNWMDAFIPTSETNISIEDNNGNAVVVNKNWENGNKTVFMGIDPISLTSTSNYWYGVSEYGLIAQALNWFGITSLETGYNIFDVPSNFKLYQNQPNPFNPITKIRFYVPFNTNIELTVYNLLGEKIVTLLHQELNTGVYTEVWNGKNHLGIDVPSGVYFYKLLSDNFIKTNKMILMK